MTEIKPFSATVYNTKTQTPSKVICPPYDVLTPSQKKSYQRLSPYNLIHLTLPVAGSGKNQYQKSGAIFRSWLKKKVLVQDEQPAIYFYQQEFQTTGANGSSGSGSNKTKRLGFIACLSLRGSSSIYGHEHTRSGPKQDRAKLLAQVKANLEPIFMLFSDPAQSIEKTFNTHIARSKPLFSFRDKQRGINSVWKLSDPAMLKKIQRSMAKKFLFIADGHHRYEVALNYQRSMSKKLKQRFNGKENFNYRMAYFCPVQSTGLVIDPIHRLVNGVDELPLDELRGFFEIQKTSKKKLFAALRSKASKRRLIGMYRNKSFYALSLKNKNVLNGIDKDYRCLDVCLLNHVVLSKLLNINPKDKQRVDFSADVPDLIQRADKHKSSLVFFLKSVKIKHILDLARMGKKMPPKTTYFYPKVPSGMTIYEF